MLAAQLNAYGDPIENIEVVEIPEPADPSAGEALVAVEYSPINPADLLLIRGYYALRPSLPAIIGNEGVGTVLAVGPGVNNVKPGDRVVAPLSSFVWRERLLLSTEGLAPLPAGADARQLAMLTVNPVAAQLLLSEFVNLQPGDWIVQNAANSGVGRSVIAIAKDRGFRTINIVRRQDAANEIKAAGGDVSLVDGPNLVEDVRAAIRDETVRLGLDGVSGQATATLASIVSQGGVVACYGAMSGTPPTANPGDLIYKQLKIGGFFLGSPEHASKFPALIAEGARLIASGKLNVPIAAIYPLADIKQAIVHAQAGGKVLLQFGRL
jgi:NADPH:quinone reductase-like Zn-dependent oxidoreductase